MMMLDMDKVDVNYTDENVLEFSFRDYFETAYKVMESFIARGRLIKGLTSNKKYISFKVV